MKLVLETGSELWEAGIGTFWHNWELVEGGCRVFGTWVEGETQFQY